MEWKRSLTGLAAAAGLLTMIFDSKLALEGARSGMELCTKTVIPSLFPFFILSMTFTTALGEHVSAPVQKIASFLGIPKNAASILLPSVLGGYPVGAKCIGDLYLRKMLSRKDAERLLAFCSNAGPSFLFGMVSCFFPERIMCWKLWLIHLISAVLTAVSIPGNKTADLMPKTDRQPANGTIILSAAKAMCMVCCWVILFRTMIGFLHSWILWAFPQWLRVFLIGILELTNGCCELSEVTDVNLRFILCSCMLSLGGICVAFQTASVTKGLSLTYYIKGKFLQTVFSFLLSCAVIKEMIFPAAIAMALPMLFIKIQKKCSNPDVLPV